MTTIAFDTDDFEKFIEKWRENNPLNKSLSNTQIVGRYLLKYIQDNNKKENKNGKQTN